MSTRLPVLRSAAALKSSAAHDYGIPPAAPARPAGRPPQGFGTLTARHRASPARATAGSISVDVAFGLAVVALGPVVAGPLGVLVE